MAEPRNTRQRRAVKDVLDRLEGFHSAQEIHEILSDEGAAIGLSTVYRNLVSLAESAEVDALMNDEGETLYRRCSVGHHHHLVCRNCGHTVEVDGPAVEKWADAMAHAHEFTEVSHTFEIFGTCKDCSQIAEQQASPEPTATARKVR